MAYTGAPSLEVRSEWRPFFEAWSQGRDRPPRIARGAQPSRREGPAADRARGLAMLGLTRAEVVELGAEVEARRWRGVLPEEEEDLFGCLGPS
eukprot:3448989-Pyramimonas_sp.AAC.1